MNAQQKNGCRSARQRGVKVFSSLAVLVLVSACSPFQRLLVNGDTRTEFLNDSCDITLLSHLHGELVRGEYLEMDDPTLVFDGIPLPLACDYSQKRMFPLRPNDSTVWVYTIKPYLVGEDEILVGSLYTLYPSADPDSEFALERRVKEYSQGKDFERGKYLLLSYRIEQDSIASIKLGRKKYVKKQGPQEPRP
ncbi:MAG: hypothetical protein R2751_15650 [Bacteroidales bacterium]